MNPETQFMLALARRSVEVFLQYRRYLGEHDVKDVPHRFQAPRASFVCIKRGNDLRGCIGTLEPRHVDACWEVIYNAVSAATEDPRFDPVVEPELPDLKFTVDLLSTLEPLADYRTNDPTKYGLLVTAGPRHGVLLPNIEGIETADQQFAIALQKAGIPPDVPSGGLRIHRFTVERFTE
ncbi:MAG: AmmeMemoRadiSam system protein A [bacterium]